MFKEGWRVRFWQFLVEFFLGLRKSLSGLYQFFFFLSRYLLFVNEIVQFMRQVFTYRSFYLFFLFLYKEVFFLGRQYEIINKYMGVFVGRFGLELGFSIYGVWVFIVIFLSQVFYLRNGIINNIVVRVQCVEFIIIFDLIQLVFNICQLLCYLYYNKIYLLIR